MKRLEATMDMDNNKKLLNEIGQDKNISLWSRRQNATEQEWRAVDLKMASSGPAGKFSPENLSSDMLNLIQLACFAL
jgi:hypothetical protein